MAIAFVFWSATYAALRNFRANLPPVLFAGAVIGAVGGVVMKIWWSEYVAGDHRMALTSLSVFDPHHPWAAANGALMSGALGMAMAGLFRAVLGKVAA
jgi:hypothetical protein